MPVPASFSRDGFISPTQCFSSRQLMIGSEGGQDTGKTEFSLSAPGRIMMISLDRGFRGVFGNPNPPKTRNPNVAVKVITAPVLTQATKAEYMAYWKSFYDVWLTALKNPECDVVVLDGDSDSWELQRLAEWGEVIPTSGHPSLGFKGVNAARRAMYNRAWDSKKIIIATNKIAKSYAPIRDANGNIVLKDGKEQRVWDGQTYEAQGFHDKEYLWDIWIRHLYKPPFFNEITKKDVPGKFGLRILRCKHNREMVGQELWQNDCTFAGLVQTVYPNTSLKDWGF